MKKYKDEPQPREDLPTRRLVATARVQTSDGNTIHLSVGFDPKDMKRPREVFYAGGFKSGSQLEFQIQDDCILISLLLQHGIRPEKISKSLSQTKRPDGTEVYGSIIGLIVDELKGFENDHAA